MARKKQPKKADDKAKEVTQKLNNIAKKKEQEKIEQKKKVLVYDDLLKELPKDMKINIRKDGFVKLIEGNVYLRNTTYGIQLLENNAGAPGKLTMRVETKIDVDKATKLIEENIKNYEPTVKEHKDSDEVKIGVKHKTRKALKSLLNKGESYDTLINRLLEK